MQEHYGFTDAEYSALLKDGVTDIDLYKSVKLFDPDNTRAPISYIGLFHYIDKKGDFNKKPMFPHKKIALALFEKLLIKGKMAVAEYIEDWENDFVEVDEDEFGEDNEI